MTIIHKLPNGISKEAIDKLKEKTKAEAGDKFSEETWNTSVESSFAFDNAMRAMEHKSKIYSGLNIVDILKDVEGAIWATLLTETQGNKAEVNALMNRAISKAVSGKPMADTLKTLVESYIAFKAFVIFGEIQAKEEAKD